MQLDDRVTVRTPEGVDIDLTLAGLGSRIGATLLDTLIQAALVFLALFALAAFGFSVGADLAAVTLGGFSVLVTVLILGYFVAFETLNAGKTPGKAAFGIRVVTDSGGAVGFSAAAIRNLVRIVDFLPGVYAVGAVTIFISPLDQRLGDLAARTLVIRDRRARPPSLATRLPATHQSDALWDVSAVTEQEAGLIRRYVERADSLGTARRTQLAEQITSRIRPKVGAPRHITDPDEFLRRVLAEKLARGR